MALDADQRLALLAIGSASIAAGLSSGRRAPWAGTPAARGLDAIHATFTTLTLGGELRGCCGTVEATRSVAEDVWRNAWASAFSDPRFPPLTRAEFMQLRLEISVLSPLEPVPAHSEQALIGTLRPHVDGLVLETRAGRATFLPAVWEQLPEPRRFVAELKRKAGWFAGHWPDDLRAYRYTTQSFGPAQ
jgi:AmmeMemoRadiSam system protein A